jgi:ABC-type glutathione transport system ATPase component
MANKSENEIQPSAILLHVEGVSKRYISGGRWGKRTPIEAVHNASFEIFSGRTLALVGASGCGKSTLARCVAGLEQSDAGRILLDDMECGKLCRNEPLRVKTQIQMVFQDAVTSLNPRLSAAEAIEEPLRILGKKRAERRRVAEEVMQKVCLSANWLDGSVMDFSGGQRQRLAIARALTMQPKLLVLDEAFSGLDLSTQFQIADLLKDLQETQNLSYLLISHDLSLVASMSDSIAMMVRGTIVENAPTQAFLENPQHIESKKLVALCQKAEASLGLALGARA